MDACEAAAFEARLPSGHGNGALGPPRDPLSDVAPWPLLPGQVLAQPGRRNDELPGGLDLLKPLSLDESIEESRSGVLEGGHGARFMNRNRSPVKPLVQIQERERARMGTVKPGRASDDAVAWYLRKRLTDIIEVEKSKNQAQIADEADIPRSALSNIYLHSRGAGPATAAALAKYLGFRSRGEMTDVADVWWATPEARDFALDRMHARERDRLPPHKPRRRTA